MDPETNYSAPRIKHETRLRPGVGSWRWVIASLFCWMTVSLFAHDPGISTAQVEYRGDSLVIVTGFAPADAQYLLPVEIRTEDKWDEAEFELLRPHLLTVAPLLWDVRSGDTRLVPRGSKVELLPGDNVSFELTFPRGPAGGPLTLRAPKVPDMPAGHRQFVVVSDERGSMITKKLLKAQDFLLEVPVAVAGVPGGSSPAPQVSPTDYPTAWEFIKLGVEHIWTGYDHLLFLFALLVVARSFRSIVGIISCFTLAHSLTLALATLHVVNLPSRLVEAVIAASIVYVGAENLWRRGEEPRGRWALTFAFGLIHGFGFASVLRDLGVGAGAQGIAMPLFTFNLGVELGQIVIAALVLPIVWQLRKREWFIRRGVAALSLIVVCAGLYWLIERTVFS